jgi:hypothetical protein
MGGIEMNDHIPDATKMISDTPRTDQMEKLVYWIQDDMTPVCDSRFVRKLERELNEAKDRIKRLEEAGDALANNHNPFTFIDWLKAREDQL